jgi:hypothetical protein
MPCAYSKLDEVARNGAFQEGLRPEVFLGAPCILVAAPMSAFPRSLVSILV